MQRPHLQPQPQRPDRSPSPKETHPDRPGGSEAAFADVADAWDSKGAQSEGGAAAEAGEGSAEALGKIDATLNSRHEESRSRHASRSNTSSGGRGSNHDEDDLDNLDLDMGLKDHGDLVRNLYAQDAPRPPSSIHDHGGRDNVSLASSLTDALKHIIPEAAFGDNPAIPKELRKAQANQQSALRALNLVPIEAGASNLNENRRRIRNNCFYLSLAASYLSGVGAFKCDPTELVEGDYVNESNQSGGASLKKRNERDLDFIEEARTASKTSKSTAAPPPPPPSSLQSRADSSKQSSMPPPPGPPPRLISYDKKVTMRMALALKRTIEASVVMENGFVGEEVQAFWEFMLCSRRREGGRRRWAWE